MKKLVLLLVALFAVTVILQANKSEKNHTDSNKALTVLCSPDLTELTNKWVEEFNRRNPDMMLMVKTIEESSIEFYPNVPVGLFTRDYLPLTKRDAYNIIVVGKDIFVPVININNPYIDFIVQHGISPGKMSEAFNEAGGMDWSIVKNDQPALTMNYYYIEDFASNSCVGEFLKSDITHPEGIKMESNEYLINSLQNDPNGIAFLRLTDVVDPDKNEMMENLMLLPVDKNGNGNIDHFEDIYGDVNTFIRGVWLGKFPHELVRNIYSVSAPVSDGVSGDDFVKWVLTDGQKYLSAGGYVDLIGSERQSKLDKIHSQEILPGETGSNYAVLKILIFIVSIVLIIALLFEVSRIYNRNRNKSSFSPKQKRHPVITEGILNIPQGLFYDKSHTWAYMEREGEVKIGMDDFLPRVTGDLTGIKMKKPGDIFKKGEIIFSLIQKGKKLDIKSPVSGTIKENNQNLVSEASLINYSPYADGWIYKITPDNWVRETQFLLMADKFKVWLKSEFVRLKDFAATIQKFDQNNTNLVLQEGGELKDSILADLGPDVWEDFQSHFIETPV